MSLGQSVVLGLAATESIKLTHSIYLFFTSITKMECRLGWVLFSQTLKGEKTWALR